MEKNALNWNAIVVDYIANTCCAAAAAANRPHIANGYEKSKEKYNKKI